MLSLSLSTSGTLQACDEAFVHDNATPESMLNSTKLKAVKESIAGIAGPQAGMVRRHGNASNFQSNSEIMHKQVHIVSPCFTNV